MFKLGIKKPIRNRQYKKYQKNTQFLKKKRTNVNSSGLLVFARAVDVICITYLLVILYLEYKYEV